MKWRAMFSGAPTEVESLREPVAAMLGHPVTALTRIGGGRNSQVYRVDNVHGGRSALKIYFRHPSDTRDRLAVEYDSFSYLWANGVRQVPQPIAKDATRGWALYQFIEGSQIPAGEVRDVEVLEASEFLGRLYNLSREPGSDRFGSASEACFTVAALIENIQGRLDRLMAVEAEGAEFDALRLFLSEEFAPGFQQIRAWSEAHVRVTGGDVSRELSREERTLSPSDFGFHNALRQPNGRIIFLDFEYFGWDDPAKMIADFLLHPAMRLSVEVKKRFAASIFRKFASQAALRGRVESVYPLYGLKWCMIMLNEFLPASLQRRQFAATAPADRAALQAQQLAKARNMLGQIHREYLNFQYCD